MAQAIEALVVDASVATKWHLLDEKDSDKAEDLLSLFGQGQLQLLAPDYILYEVPSAIWAATIGRQPRISLDQGREAINEFLDLGITTIRDAGLIRDAYSLSHQYGCPFYDSLYLAVAERLQLRFITADERLYERIRNLPYAILIGDYQPPTA